MIMEIKDRATQRAVDQTVAKLRRRQVQGSREAALETVLLLRSVVASAKFSSIEQLLGMVRGVGKRLVEARPGETSVGNIVRKVLKLIRDESAAVAPSSSVSGTATPILALALTSGASGSRPTMLDRANSVFMSTSSVANFITMGHRLTAKTPLSPTSGQSTPQRSQSMDADSRKAVSMKPALIDAIQEVIDELETVYENVAKNAREHIHADEIVLTIGKSRTVEMFLKAAARDRKFTVIVAETAPSYSGTEMATSLSAAGISTVLVPDSCVYALMSRVNKVVIGAHSIMANGGIFGIAGSLLAASAAYAHTTPVLVCAGQFKVSPLWNLHQRYASVDLGDPERVLSASLNEGADDWSVPDDVDVINPWFDYVKPELVNVLITNYGDHPPAYVYRLVQDIYDEEDLDI